MITNQAGVARGLYGTEAVERLHAWMNAQLAAIGAHVDEFQYCPFHEEGSIAEFRRASTGVSRLRACCSTACGCGRSTRAAAF